MNRYILCRPESGLNDMLSQIELCCRYAEKTGRYVIIDTNYSKTKHFRDKFSNYFTSRHKRLLLNLDQVQDDIEKLTVFPNCLIGRVNSYDIKYSEQVHNWTDMRTGVKLSFDFNRDYAEPLLVHHQCGRTDDAWWALLRLSANENIIEELGHRLQQVDPFYSAIHIRHTDYTTNYKLALDFFKKNQERLFVATDNSVVINDFVQALSRERVYSFSQFPTTQGKPIHLMENNEVESYRANVDAISDLIMLSLSHKLYMIELGQNQHGTKYSGYSVLANQLNTNKTLLKLFLNTDKISFGLN